MQTAYKPTGMLLQGGGILNTDDSPERRMVEQCYRTTSTMINPIVDWNDDDVWEFLKYYKKEVNPLYNNGYCRVGCVGCPMAGKAMITELQQYPKYAKLYLRAIDRMLKKRKEENNLIKFGDITAEQMFLWLILEGKYIPNGENQLSLFGNEDYYELLESMGIHYRGEI